MIFRSGREHLDILQDRSCLGALRGVLLARWRAGDNHIHAHSLRGEAGDAHHLVDLDCAGSHAGGNGGGQSAAGAHRGQAALDDRFARIKVRDDAPSNQLALVFFGDGARWDRTRDFNGLQVLGGENGPKFDVRARRGHARNGGRPCCRHTAANHARHEVSASSCYNESNQKDRE